MESTTYLLDKEGGQNMLSSLVTPCLWDDEDLI
jgi:hypothetical protein